MNMPLSEIKKKCKKPGNTVETKYISFSRNLSVYFIKLFLFLRLTPNFVSVLGLFAVLASLFVFIYGYVWFGFWIAAIVGSLLLHLSQFFDVIDGGMARSTGKTSEMGRFLDGLLQNAMYFFFAAIGIGLFFATGESIHLITGFVATLFKNFERMVSFDFRITTFDILQNKNKKANIGKLYIEDLPTKRGIKSFFSNLSSDVINSIGLLLPIVTLFALINRMDLFLLIYAIYSPMYFLLAFARYYKDIKKVSKL